VKSKSKSPNQRKGHRLLQVNETREKGTGTTTGTTTTTTTKEAVLGLEPNHHQIPLLESRHVHRSDNDICI
jgi:hypothetical protein